MLALFAHTTVAQAHQVSLCCGHKFHEVLLLLDQVWDKVMLLDMQLKVLDNLKLKVKSVVLYY